MRKIISLSLITFLVSFNSIASVDFDNTDDSLETNTAVTAPTTITFSIWMRADSSGEGGFGRIMVFDNGAAASTEGLSISAGLDLAWRVDWSTTDLTDTFDTNLSTGVWYHILITYDGSSVSNHAVAYVNGASTTSPSASASGTLTTSFNEIIIGNVGDGARTFDGKLSEAAIWNVVLTQSEIDILAKSRVKNIPLQIRPSALMRYWPLDDKSDGSSGDGFSFRDYSSTDQVIVGSDGANNTGLTVNAEEVLSHP